MGQELESIHVNLSSTPYTVFESYILCLHCTSRRDLKEKERNGFCGISQFVVYWYFSIHLFLNTVPPPAVNHPCTLQPLLSTIHESPKCVVECKPLNPWHISMGACLWRCQGITHTEQRIPREHRPNESLQPLTLQGGCPCPPPTPTLLPQGPRGGPVTLWHPSSWWLYSQSIAAAPVL